MFEDFDSVKKNKKYRFTCQGNCDNPHKTLADFPLQMCGRLGKYDVFIHHHILCVTEYDCSAGNIKEQPTWHEINLYEPDPDHKGAMRTNGFKKSVQGA
ncbi:MAG TPA: hypothetical protein PK004_08480 [Smithella sp.]|nr:hypothetical protein [Smithella sp.]HOS14832.1 hypothetical protein [Smithella sp.]HPC08871.1 hypothetical protein [Smithella sp.]HPN86811.1 hypothetical protein [Smithella sp.]HQC19090.1 hypothetical protein [Smithella sp.]